jgi:hypothetical protein
VFSSPEPGENPVAVGPDVWLSDCDLPLPVEDAIWLSARLQELSGRMEGAADAAAALEAAARNDVSRDVALDVAEMSAVRAVLADADGRIQRSHALLALAERLHAGLA